MGRGAVLSILLLLLAVGLGLGLLGWLGYNVEAFEASPGQNPNPTKKSVTCPVGSFCPPNSDTHFLCPGGTYGGTQGLKTPQCSGLCDAGRICDVGSTTAQGQKACPGGYYCIAGTSSSGPVTPIVCPEGHYCPEGSKTPTLCPDGVYCPKGTATLS